MSLSRFTKLARIITGLLAGLLLAIPAVPLSAQQAPQSRTSRELPEEITLSGTVSSVLARSAPGMVVGPHLLLTTPSGEVDASLGRFGGQGKGALSVAPGQQIEMTGFMRTLHDKQVFLVRTAKVGGRVYILRNERGISLPPQARLRASQRGGSL